MTVSRALRGKPGISAEERARVCAIATKLGYRPDPVVTRLMLRLRGSRLSGPEPIAWLTSHTTRAGWKNNPASREIHAGASERASILGYRIEEFWANEPGLSAHRLGAILDNRAIRGVIVAPLGWPQSFPALPWDRFAAVCCGYSLPTPILHRAASDQFQSLQVVWQALWSLGYRRIGLCLPRLLDQRVNHLWQGAFAVAQAGVSNKYRLAPLIADDWSEKTFLRWFDQKRPDAVISMAEAHDWLRRGGVEVPRDCGFADINGTESRLAGVNHHLEQIGAAAVDVVAGELAVGKTGVPAVPKTVLVAGSWKPGPSVLPVPRVG